MRNRPLKNAECFANGRRSNTASGGCSWRSPDVKNVETRRKDKVESHDSVPSNTHPSINRFTGVHATRGLAGRDRGGGSRIESAHRCNCRFASCQTCNVWHKRPLARLRRATWRPPLRTSNCRYSKACTVFRRRDGKSIVSIRGPSNRARPAFSLIR